MNAESDAQPKILDSGHILVVDDDKEIRDLLARFLRKHGYRVTPAENGREMRAAIDAGSVNLVILDLMLQAEDGLVLCRELRAQSPIPIIILTAVGDETDRIIGLEMGADDYVAKPFNPRELLARVRAVLRRFVAGGSPGVGGCGNHIRFAGWSWDLARRELSSPEGVIVDLSAGEHDLLLAFVEHPQRVLSRDQLLDMARSRTASPFDRSIDVQVSRLRRKVDEDNDKPLIKTVRGVGYVFTAPIERK